MAQRPTQSLSPRLPASLTGLKKFPDFRHSYMFLARHPLFPAHQHPSQWHYLPLYNSVTTRHPRLPPHSPSPRFSFLKDLNSFLNDSISYPFLELKILPPCLWNSMNRQETLFFLMFLSLSSPNWPFPKDTAPTIAPCEGSWFLFHISFFHSSFFF